MAVAAYFLATFFDNRRRQAAGVPSRPVGEIVLRTGVLAVFTFGPAAVFNQYKGLPLAVVLFLVVLVGTDFVLRRTTFGRNVFALGGSVEASRRAGINVTGIRIAVFAIMRHLRRRRRALLGLQDRGRQPERRMPHDLLMNVIAAAVIGGTSLFGGRGRTWNALLGVMVITSIQYGLALEGIATPIQYMITGAVLLATVVIDSVTRKTQKTAGRA